MNTENQKCVGVVFSNRAIQDIKTETYDKDPVETGGLLLGYVLESGHWVVVEIIPPGDNSTHRYAYLEYDESLAQRVVNQIADKYEQKLELLGLWHRHPGSMDFFSGTDDGTNITFAELNPSYGAISGLVNIDPKFRMTMYHVDSPLNYTKVETFVGDDIIPAELLKLKEGVTFEEIDAIKKPKTRSEQQPAAPQQTSQQTRQTTPNREEPRRTTPSRENHEKPQVVIQRPETLTGVFKKIILEHTTAFCFLVASVIVVLAGVFIFTSFQKTELRKEEIAAETKKLEEERKAKEAETKKLEEERKRQEAEAKQAEEARKTEQAKAEQAQADAEKAKAAAAQAQAQADTEKAKAAAAQAQAQADTEKAKAAAAQAQAQAQAEKANAAAAQAQAQAQAEKANASAVAMSEEGREKKEPSNAEENALSERQVAGNPSAPDTETKDNNITANGKENKKETEKKCAELLGKETNFQEAQKYYKEKLLKHRNGGDCRKHLGNLNEVLTKLSDCKEQRQTVEDLIKNIDPAKLKQEVEKADCNKQDAYKALETINTCNSCQDKNIYDGVLKKWKKQCKNNSKKKSGKK